MSEGLKTTFDLLSTTENEAAVRTLVAGLDSPDPEIAERSLAAILGRRSPAAQREILRRLHTFDRRWMDRLRQQRRLGHAPRDAILDTDPQMCANGCRAALWLREYDLVPTILTALEDPSGVNRELLGKTLLELAEMLYVELSGRGGGDVREARLVRSRVVGSLEMSLGRFARHRRGEVVEAFLLLAPRDNATLKTILQNPHHPAYDEVMRVLSTSSAGGVVRLLLSMLDDAHTPPSALTVISRRSDLKFVRYLLRKIGRDPSPLAVHNLKRIREIDWLRQGGALLDELDEPAQHGAVRLVMASGVPRLRAYDTIEYLVRHGKRAGRRAATEALAEFHGARANALAVAALEDEDPQVQANVIRQLRSRGIPGVLPRMVGLLESPHAVVRDAARASLSEFMFPRFLAAYDMLDDEVRRSTGALVRKVDPETVPRLREELQSRIRSRRLRAVGIVRTIGLIDELEPEVIALLDDADHLVRTEAATALAESQSVAAAEALRRALDDRSQAVQRAAAGALKQQEDTAAWLASGREPNGGAGGWENGPARRGAE